MPWFVNIIGTLQGTWDQPDENSGALIWCAADIFSNITNCEIQWPVLLIARKICQVSLVRCPYDSHTCRPCRELILGIPPPIVHVDLAVDSTTLAVSEAHPFKLEVRLKWEMCLTEMDTFENIPEV
jgi:hypothetical protein